MNNKNNQGSEQPTLGYNEFVQQIRHAPITWLPGLLVEVAECCAARNVFQPEGMLNFLRNKMKARNAKG